MKIKKIFVLPATLALGFLMAGCTNKIKVADSVATEKNILESYAIDTTELKGLVKDFIKIDEGFEYLYRDNDIVIAKKNNRYKVYDFDIKKEAIFEFDDIEEINKDGIKVSQSSNEITALFIPHKSNTDGYYKLDVYLANGVKVVDKALVKSFDTPTEISSMFYKLEDGYALSNKYKFSYVLATNNEDDEKANKEFYTFKKLGKDIFEDEDEALVIMTEEEIKAYEKYATNNLDYDATSLGLKGYKVDVVSLMTSKKYVIKKDDKIVNTYQLADNMFGDTGIVNEGCYLYQTYESVGAHNDYDIAYGSKYLKVKTYSYNLVSGKTKEIKDFHYFLDFENTSDIEIKNKDDETIIFAYKIKALDFSKEKSYSETSTKKTIILNAKGEVFGDDNLNEVYKENDKYYSYANGLTKVYDAKGNVVEQINGRYRSGIIINSSNGSYVFYKASTKEFIASYSNITYITYNELIASKNDEQYYVVLNNGEITETKFTKDLKYDSSIKVFYKLSSVEEKDEFDVVISTKYYIEFYKEENGSFTQLAKLE